MTRHGVSHSMPDLSTGACRGRLEEFRDIDTINAGLAIEVCLSGCPVLQACGEWGIRHEAFGVWGAMSARTLAAERRRLGIDLVPVTIGDLAMRPGPGRRAPAT